MAIYMYCHYSTNLSLVPSMYLLCRLITFQVVYFREQSPIVQIRDPVSHVDGIAIENTSENHVNA